MTDPKDLTAALINAHTTGSRFTPEPISLSRIDILAVQSEVMAALGAIAGFKVGRGAAGQLPTLAPIPAVYCAPNGGERKVRDQLGIELEVGFELIRELPDGAFPEDVQNYFWPCVVLEVVDTRIAGDLAKDPSFKLADLQINAGLVKGDELTDWDGSDFGTLTAKLVAGAETVLNGETTVPGGSALSNLELLADHIGDHCGGLTVGQIVITGSLCGLPYFGAGTEISGEIDGLGSVSLTLT